MTDFSKDNRRSFIKKVAISTLAITSGISFQACAKQHNLPDDSILKFPVLEIDPEVRISESLFDQSRKNNLGLNYATNTEQITIFRPEQELDMKFNNHPQLVDFKGKLYATWVGHPLHEPSAESYVYYSYSTDGKKWSKPIQIGPPNRASGGWLTDGNHLSCLLISGDKVNKTSITEYCHSLDGLNWSAPKVLIQNAGPSESARRLPNGRFIMVCHGLGTGDFKAVRGTRIMYSDAKDGLSDWKQGFLPDLPGYNANDKEKVARAVEASWFRRKDNTLVMLFRDLWFEQSKRTWKLLAAVSKDNGSSWSVPVLTNITDSDSMQCAGSLPSGTIFFVNNPVPTRRRVPLTLTISKDGKLFDKSYLLRDIPQPRRYEGISKTEGYSYPGSLVWKEHLYVAYATNKEDVEITRIPIKSLN